MININDRHLAAAYFGSATAESIIDLLPKTDLVEDLKTIIAHQKEILWCALNEKNYGTHKLDSYLAYTETLLLQTELINPCKENV